MSTITSPIEIHSEKGLRGLATRRPLITFFVLAFAISWSLSLVLLLGANGLGLLDYTIPNIPAQLLIILQSFGPLAAGLITAALTGSGARKLLSGYGRLRVKPAWYLVALLAAPVFVMLGATLVKGPGAWSIIAEDGAGAIPAFLILLVMLFFIGGPLGEEAGWRGFALPRLQNRFGALAASLILGGIWAAWHLPNFFIPQMNTWQGSLLIYLVLALSLSILHTWVYNGTGGSLFLVTLLHAAVDAASRLLLPEIFETDRAGGNLALFAGFVIWAVLVLLLTRGKLGYRSLP